MKPPQTLGESLFWSYANLAMAHRALAAGETTWGRIGYMVRARLYKGLCAGTMNLGSLVDEERVKLNLDRVCAYCGCDGPLSVDHLLPRKRGGLDVADNIVWSCRTCNSSKGARDVLEWYRDRGEFPPLLLLRRYLKLAIQHCTVHGLLRVPLADAADLALPFSVAAIPGSFPPPSDLVLVTAARRG